MVQIETVPSRRALILGVGAALASGADAQAQGVLQTWPLGLQLFTVDAQLKADLPGTLAALKQTGYQTVETAGLQGLTAAAYRAQIEAAGLACRSAHVAMGDLVSNLDAHIADALALGAGWLVCSSPVPPTPIDPTKDWVAAMVAAMTPDAWRSNAAQLALIAPKVRRAGLTLAWHNHPMEFRDWGGVCGYDILLAAAPPSLLSMEMDLGWVVAAGRDPVATMRRYALRVAMLHVKDMVRDPAAPVGYRSVAVGEGIIDWPAVFAAARAVGVRGFFVEQEPPFQRPVMTSLQISRDYLSRI